MLMRDGSEIKEQAESLVMQLKKGISNATVEIMSGFSQMGSGSLPAQNLATTLVAVRPAKVSAESLAKQLRQNSTPIFARIQNDQVLFDPRTMLAGDDEIILKALPAILGGEQ
jgi:L-seryl-tRNA(Ser) seleniumtransferase